MNRGIALFLCLAALLAHTLAIHNDGSGSLAPTYDRAYAAFRMARELVHEGTLRWNPNGPAFESYPSLAWCLWIALAERLGISPNLWSQLSGIAAALATVVLLSRFEVDRIASLIGPILLVASGGVAAAAASGTETALTMLAVTAAFLAFEKGWRAAFGATLAALCLIRPEGCWIAGGLLALELAGARPRPAQTAVSPAVPPGARPRPRWAAFAAAGLAVAAACVLRSATTGEMLSPIAAGVLAPDPGQWQDGLAFVRDAFVGGASPLLVVVPLALLVAGRLPPSGRHALFLAGVWLVGCVARGGGRQPFHEPLVPALPLLFHAVQQGLTVGLNAPRALVRRAAAALFAAAIALSGLASTFPSDYGWASLDGLHERWMRASPRSRPEHEASLGRAGLAEEIRQTQRLRALGLFLRDHVDPGATVLTAWPGSIAYLSRLTVLDALGRATPRPGSRRPAPWDRPARADMVAWLEQEPEYVVPMLFVPARAPTRAELAATWTELFDIGPPGEARQAEIVAALAPYELISVPVSIGGQLFGRERVLTPYLLRRRDLDARPTLELTVRGRAFSVRTRNRGHEQLANLMVTVTAADGRELAMRPTGEFVEQPGTFARTSLLLYATDRPVELVRATFEELERQGVVPVRVRASLLNPGCVAETDLSNVAEPVERPVE